MDESRDRFCGLCRHLAPLRLRRCDYYKMRLGVEKAGSDKLVRCADCLEHGRPPNSLRDLAAELAAAAKTMEATRRLHGFLKPETYCPGCKEGECAVPWIDPRAIEELKNRR